VDFRGRLVTGTTLNFTAPDHIRGLFQFAEGAPITERGIYWLKIACATAFNEWKEVSKQTFTKRHQWADENLARICAAGRKPLEHLEWLKDAGDPIQCVALFNELANAREEGPSYISTVPIGFDATCSGLQNYALLARDYQTARYTNLVPSDDPKDIYDRIFRPVQWQLATRANEGDEQAHWWLGDASTPGRINRKVIKALVMTYCYSSVPWGQADQVYKKLRKDGEDIPSGAPHNLVKLVRQAIEKHIKIAPAIMKELRALVGKSEPVRWVSPSGLPVANSYPKSRIKTVRHYLHDKSHRCVIGAEWKRDSASAKQGHPLRRTILIPSIVRCWRLLPAPASGRAFRF
jgi:Autographiviridae RNA polymerase